MKNVIKLILVLVSVFFLAQEKKTLSEALGSLKEEKSQPVQNENSATKEVASNATLDLNKLSSIKEKSDNNSDNSKEEMKDESENSAQKAMIYPGCKEFRKDNNELYRCFNENFQKDLIANLPKHSAKYRDPIFLEENQTCSVKLSFALTEEGLLELKKGESNVESDCNKVLTKSALIAFSRLSNEMEYKQVYGEGIVPAKAKDGQPTKLYFTIPFFFTGPM